MRLARIGSPFSSLMSTTIALELFAGFLAACLALWFVARRFAFLSAVLSSLADGLRPRLATYLLQPGHTGSLGLLLLRLTVGVMMIHHGQEKLADPQAFASTYVASLHLPFPLFFAYAAGLSELIGSWLLIFGLFTPLGALAISGTMAVAAYQHISTAGFNIYVLELVALYLGGALALLLLGPGLFSADRLLLLALYGSRSSATELDLQSAPAVVADR